MEKWQSGNGNWRNNQYCFAAWYATAAVSINHYKVNIVVWFHCTYPNYLTHLHIFMPRSIYLRHSVHFLAIREQKPWTISEPCRLPVILVKLIVRYTGYHTFWTHLSRNRQSFWWFALSPPSLVRRNTYPFLIRLERSSKRKTDSLFPIGPQRLNNIWVCVRRGHGPA